MKPTVYAVLAVGLLVATLAFFFECVSFLSRRDYVAAFLLFFIGLTISRVASEMARLGLASRAGGGR